MVEKIDNKFIVDNDYCQQCGTCIGLCTSSAISMCLRDDGVSILSILNEKCINCGMCYDVCPANKKLEVENIYDHIKRMSYCDAYAKDDDIRNLSSSGGVAKTIIVEGLNNGIFDAVYVLKKSDIYPYVEGAYIDKNDGVKYEDIPNSIYHPVMMNLALKKVKKVDKLLIVGTPCQIKGAEEYLKGRCNKLTKVALFCKQQKTLDSTKFIAKLLNTSVDIKKPFSAKYRGDGWPGIIRINKKEIPLENGVAMSMQKRLWTVNGCKICGIPFGDKVDLSLMDPWGGYYKKSDNGITVVVIQSSQGEKILSDLNAHINIEKKSFKQIKRVFILDDIQRKIILIPYFLKEKIRKRILFAGKFNDIQDVFYRNLVEVMPRMPLKIYSILCRVPDIRDLILSVGYLKKKYNQK